MKRLGIIGLVVVGIALIVAAVLFLNQDRGVGSADPPAEPTNGLPEQGVDEPANQAEQVAQTLRGVVDDPSGSVVDELKEGLDPRVALPEGSTLEPLVDTWAPDGIGGGTMNTILHFAGEPDEYYLVVMVEDSGSWKIMSTFAQEVEQ